MAKGGQENANWQAANRLPFDRHSFNRHGDCMQNAFYWINEPAEWHSENNRLSVVTDDHTDFWRHTWYGFERFSGHIYATDAAGDFTFQTKIRAEFSTLYDQAGIMLMSDEQHWLKAGIEYNDGAPAIGSVLTLQASDWATGIFPGNPGSSGFA